MTDPGPWLKKDDIPCKSTPSDRMVKGAKPGVPSWEKWVRWSKAGGEAGPCGVDEASIDLRGQMRCRWGTSRVSRSSRVDCLSAFPLFPFYKYGGKGGRLSSVSVNQRHFQLGEVTLLRSTWEETMDRAGWEEEASLVRSCCNCFIKGDHPSAPGVLILYDLLWVVTGQAWLGGKSFWVKLAADEENRAADVLPIVWPEATAKSSGSAILRLPHCFQATRVCFSSPQLLLIFNSLCVVAILCLHPPGNEVGRIDQAANICAWVHLKRIQYSCSIKVSSLCFTEFSWKDKCHKVF